MARLRLWPRAYYYGGPAYGYGGPYYGYAPAYYVAPRYYAPPVYTYYAPPVRYYYKPTTYEYTYPRGYYYRPAVTCTAAGIATIADGSSRRLGSPT